MERSHDTQTYRVLGAMLQLGQFTARELTEISGANYHTVRTVIARHRELLAVRERAEADGRGRPPFMFVLTPAGRKQLGKVLSQPPPAVESSAVPSSLLAIHEALLRDDHPDPSLSPSEVIREADEELRFADEILDGESLSRRQRAVLKEQLAVTRFLVDLTRAEVDGPPEQEGPHPSVLEVAKTEFGRLFARVARSARFEWVLGNFRKLESAPRVVQRSPYAHPVASEVPAVSRRLMDDQAGRMAVCYEPTVAAKS